jgi:hypothetical protein
MTNTEYDELKSQYVNPVSFLFTPLEENEFESFKGNSSQSGKVFYCLNNFPQIMHDIIINALCYSGHNTMSHNYYTCIVKKSNNNYVYDFEHLYRNNDRFISDLTDKSIRFIMIRICEPGNNAGHIMTIGHITSIIIDKEKEYILFFDSKNEIRYSLEQFMFVINTINLITCSDYQILTPYDLGYNKGNALQGKSMYCQTCSLYVYAVIVCNPDVSTKEFKTMFTQIINNESLSLFLFFLYKVISSNPDLDNTKEYHFPCISNTVANIFNNLSLLIRLNIRKLVNLCNDKNNMNESMHNNDLIINAFNDELSDDVENDNEY